MNAIYALATQGASGVTAIVIAERVVERDSSQTHGDASTLSGAHSLAASLSCASGAAVHLIYNDAEGEHRIDVLPGPGAGRRPAAGSPPKSGRAAWG